MIYLSLFIPFILLLILIVWKQKFHPLMIGFSFLIPFPIIFDSCSEHSLTRQNEILGGNVLSASYYEPWDEYIHQTCTRQVNCRTDKNGLTTCDTETYDCSYVENHSEYWELETTFGDMSCTSGEYNYLKKKFNNSKFVDMNRDFHSYDGDKYTSIWNGDSISFEPYFMNHEYENRIQASKSIFNYENADTVKYKLIPRIVANSGDVHSFISNSINVSKGNSTLNYYNAVFGKSKQLRMIAIVFKNQPLQISIEQEKYWKGGNKNEFVTTIGIDNDSNIVWVRNFSWTMKKELIGTVRDEIYNMKKFDDLKIANYLGKTIPKKWTRREFKEFKYLSIETPSSIIIWNYVLVIILSGVIFALTLVHIDDF